MSRDLIRLMAEALRELCDRHQRMSGGSWDKARKVLAKYKAHLAGDVEPTDERVAFEEWAWRAAYWPEKSSIKGRTFSSENTEHAWRAWQAARSWKPEPKKEPTP